MLPGRTRQLAVALALGVAAVALLITGALASTNTRAGRYAQKKTILDAVRTRMADAPRAPKQDPDKARPSSSPQPPALDGIFDNAAAGASPWSSGDGYNVQNQYFGHLGGHSVEAYAGAHGSNQFQGLIICVFDATPYKATKAVFYDTPTAAGPVQFVSVQGSRLTLATSDGARSFVFDWILRSFLPA